MVLNETLIVFTNYEIDHILKLVRESNKLAFARCASSRFAERRHGRGQGSGVGVKPPRLCAVGREMLNGV